ncbi:hypothetical protein AXF42_Ash020400 [Apostasia shenzhenica]|uniref:Mitochondrial fission 1 protein n=1 Tax=Apostasia shenzhenica TaxID=1088818 RepID=A0A2I0AA67_9ASPA|nr:hypothetical protein AXF42_Ash020400 [Apostasia shenzhenica]
MFSRFVDRQSKSRAYKETASTGIFCLATKASLRGHRSSPVLLAVLRKLHRPIMDANISRFFESVGSFFGGGDNIPWCDRDIIAGFEKEVAEAENAENKNEILMRLSWALVHSRQPEDVNRGIAMLEASLEGSSSPLQMREKLYLLAVGHYRNGDYARSRQLLGQCLELLSALILQSVLRKAALTRVWLGLEISPDWRQALNLKKVVEDRIARDGVIGIGIAATALGLVIGGIAAAVARRR